MVVAMLSGMMAWLAGPSKGLLQIGRQYGYLPPYFQKLNADGIQMNILVAQGVVISIIGLLYAFVPDVSSVYWIFSVMTTQVYLIMYVLMFVAAVMLRRKQPNQPRGYQAPALVFQCVVGGVASVLAFLIGFVPPSQFGHSNPITLRTAGARRGPGAGSAAARAALQAAQAVVEGPRRRGRYRGRERRNQHHGRERSGRH